MVWKSRKNKFMTYKEFVKKLDTHSTETILMQVSQEQLKDKAIRLWSNSQVLKILENSTVEGIYFKEDIFFMVFRKGKKFFQIDFCKYGLTLAELIPTEKIDFWNVDLRG